MKKFKLAIAGGGSTFTPGIVKSLMVKMKDFPLEEIRLYDVDGERQEKIAVIIKQVIADYTDELPLIVTTNPEIAFKDADFVFAQMRVGKYKMRESDEKIPLKYGVVGQETCGPGGLAYGLRTIFPMVELIDLVEKYSNNAWIINYSNPAAIVAEGVRRLRPNSKVLNICDMPVAIMRNMSEILGCQQEDMTVNYFGLNHFGWFTNVFVNGEDRLPELREYIQQNGILHEKHMEVDIQHSEPSWIKTYTNAKPVMELFPEYIPNTYLQYYLLPDYIVEHQNTEYTRANEVIDGREKKLFNSIDEYLQTGIMPEAFHVGVHGSFIVDLVISLAFDKRERYLVIVENNGAIAGLPDDAMVEVPAYITSQGPEPIRIGNVSLFYKALMEQQLASEKLLVEAAVEGSYDKALQAFTMNKTVPSALVAKKILDDMIEANEEYWPELKKQVYPSAKSVEKVR